MSLSDKIVSLIDEGYEVRFMGDDICRGLKIRVSKSMFKCQEFIGYDDLCKSITGSDFVIGYTLDKLVHKIDKMLKGRA